MSYQRKRYTPEERDRILRLYRTMKPGTLLKEAAHLLDVPASTLSTWIEQKRRESRPAPKLPVQPTLEQQEQEAKEVSDIVVILQGIHVIQQSLQRLQADYRFILARLTLLEKAHGE